MASFDDSVAIAFDHDGLLACRVDGATRVTTITTESVIGRWLFILIRHQGDTTDLYLDGEPADSWSSNATPAEAAGIKLMPDIDGAVREVTIYERALADVELELLTGYFLGRPDGAVCRISS